jgi:type IV pilus assembly protein PilY1
MLRDTKIGNDGSGQSTIVHSNLFDATSTAYTYNGSDRGFYIILGTGEKVVNAPTTVAGYTYFGTNQPTAPSANSCTANLGIARGYSIQPLTGIYTSSEFEGGGLPPSPVSGLVNVIVMVNGVPTTKLVPFMIGGGGGSGSDSSSSLGGKKPTINVKTSRHRAYWYKN